MAATTCHRPPGLCTYPRYKRALPREVLNQRPFHALIPSQHSYTGPRPGFDTTLPCSSINLD